MPPPPAPRKTSRAGKWIAGIVVVLVLLGTISALTDDDSTDAGRAIGAGSPSAGATSAGVTQPSATRTPTPVPTATSVPTPPLEILSMRTESNGVGGFYTYVRIVNHTDETIDYVGLNGMCYDASGVRVGDGIGNTASVGPGETVEITVIFVIADGCTRVKVQFDDLTRLFL